MSTKNNETTHPRHRRGRDYNMINKTINMFKNLHLLLLLLAFPLLDVAQITQQQARPVDSALATEYLDASNFHTINYHAVTFPPGGYFTWDAGCGLYLGIDDYYIAWSHTGMVADTLAACIDTMPSQAYRLFNLATMPGTDAYKDSVELWLGSLGVLVDIPRQNALNIKIWPNPLQYSSILNITFPASGSYSINIFDMNGKTVYNNRPTVLAGETNNFNLKRLKQGCFVLTVGGEGKHFSRIIYK